MAAEVAQPWKSLGNVIVNVSVKQAQTQEAKRVHGGMQRHRACDCTALIDFFILLGKVIQGLFMTLVPFSCLFGDANPLEKCTGFGDFHWLCCMVLLSCGCGQPYPHRSLARVSTPFTREVQSHLEHGCVSAEHHSELLCQRTLLLLVTSN